jgi:hypothetical protein
MAVTPWRRIFLAPHGAEDPEERKNHTEDQGTMQKINFTTLKATLMGLTILAMALAGSAGARWS